MRIYFISPRHQSIDSFSVLLNMFNYLYILYWSVTCTSHCAQRSHECVFNHYPCPLCQVFGMIQESEPELHNCVWIYSSRP